MTETLRTPLATASPVMPTAVYRDASLEAVSYLGYDLDPQRAGY